MQADLGFKGLNDKEGTQISLRSTHNIMLPFPGKSLL